jgi:hypothetical protein
MSEITRTSFTYDPARQGYDTNSWRTLSGTTPTVAGGCIVLDGGAGTNSTIHYADITKGDIYLTPEQCTIFRRITDKAST